MADDKSDLLYTPVILVTRGDERPKKNYEKKKHPTYETSIIIKGPKGSSIRCQPHVVCKFFDQYRTLHENLQAHGIGEDKKIPINASFPPTHTSSTLGFQMSEDQLQQRCFKLNKWMQAVFASFPLFPEEAQKILSDFLSLGDDDADSEANKELILTMIKRKYENPSLGPGSGPSNKQSFPGHSAGSNNTNNASNKVNNGPNELSQSSSPSTPNTGSSNNLSGMDKASSNKVEASGDGSLARPDPDSKRFSSAQSTVSEVYKGLTTAELGEYSKETYVNGYLAVSVLSGEMMAKSTDDTKLHHSYETIIRILPFEESSASSIPDVDTGLYEKINGLPPISVSYPFDKYRSLKQDLEETGVFTRDNTRGANEYNEKTTKLYSSGSNPMLAIILDCDFPRTYKRSSLGFALSEQQLHERRALLNNWLGNLLKAFLKVSPNAQAQITDFLGLMVRDVHITDNEDVSLLNLQDQNNTSKIFLLMMKNKFVAPKIKPPEPPVDKKKDKKKDKEKKVTIDVPPVVTTTEAVVLTEGENDAVVVSSLPESAPEVKRVPQERPDGKSEISTASSVAMTPQKIGEFSKETIIYSFLGVKVTKGEMVAKDHTDKKRHQGYETVIRVLSYAEMVYTEKDRVDQEAYNKMQNSLSFISVTKVFDGYRTLKMNLEKEGIYCHDYIPSGTKLNNQSIVLEASFPQTHRRSSLGFGLTEMQIHQRTAQLNRWMGALMSKFHVYTPEVQDMICDFLTIADDDPSEPQGKTIISMLRRKYVPPMKVVSQSHSGEKKRNSDDDDYHGNSVSSYGYSKNTKKSDDNDDDDHHQGGHSVAANGCCVIM